MHKLLVLYPEPADRETFREYYESKHLSLAEKLPGLLAWRYSCDVQSESGESAYFALFEAEFETKEAMENAMASPEGRAVQADVSNYASGGAVVLNYPVQP